MSQERCLQMAIGSCGGCPIQEIVLEKRRDVPRAEEHALVERVQAELCPEGVQMQVPARREPPIL